MRPGRPLASGRVGKALFSIAGHPVATLVGYCPICITGAAQRHGRFEPLPLSFRAQCLSLLRKRAGRVEYQRGQCALENGVVTVRSTETGGGRLSSLVLANRLIVLEADRVGLACRLGDRPALRRFDVAFERARGPDQFCVKVILWGEREQKRTVLPYNLTTMVHSVPVLIRSVAVLLLGVLVGCAGTPTLVPGPHPRGGGRPGSRCTTASPVHFADDEDTNLLITEHHFAYADLNNDGNLDVIVLLTDNDCVWGTLHGDHLSGNDDATVERIGKISLVNGLSRSANSPTTTGATCTFACLVARR